MGTKISKVTPLEGFIAETAGACTLELTEYLKYKIFRYLEAAVTGNIV